MPKVAQLQTTCRAGARVVHPRAASHMCRVPAPPCAARPPFPPALPAWISRSRALALCSARRLSTACQYSGSAAVPLSSCSWMPASSASSSACRLPAGEAGQEVHARDMQNCTEKGTHKGTQARCTQGPLELHPGSARTLKPAQPGRSRALSRPHASAFKAGVGSAHREWTKRPTCQHLLHVCVDRLVPARLADLVLGWDGLAAQAAGQGRRRGGLIGALPGCGKQARCLVAAGGRLSD